MSVNKQRNRLHQPNGYVEHACSSRIAPDVNRYSRDRNVNTRLSIASADSAR